MIRRVVVSLVLVVLAGLGALAWMARHSFPKVPVEVPAPPSRAALEDDTLLLQRWLARQGHPVRSGGGTLPVGELPRNGLLVLLRIERPLSPTEAGALLTWVQGGGHLLVDATASPFNDASGPAALLDLVGAQAVQVPGQEADAYTTHTDRFEPGEDPYVLSRSRSWRLKLDTATWDSAMGTDEGQVLARRREGDGTLILASDLSYLRNNPFGKLDHAAWTARVLREAEIPAGAPVWVWSRPAMPGLLPWLWTHAWAFLVSLAVLLAAWIWRGLWRFGSPLPGPVTVRRSLLEHFAHAGRLVWRSGGAEALVAACRRTVLRRAARLHPAFPRLSPEATWTWLGQRGGIAPEAVADALDDRPGAAPDRLAHRLTLLLTLYQSLRGRPWKR